jgi:hypothetical protein
MSLQPSDFPNPPRKNELGVRLLFLLVFIFLGVYLRAKTMSAPIYPFMYRFDILPHLNSSFFDLILSEHHRTIQIYRNAFSVLFINWFGVNDYTPRIFSVIVAFCTFWLMYRFTKRYIGTNEAVISVLLIGVSYSSIHHTIRPQYGGFYVFASLWTVWALFKAYETGKKSYWWMFVVANFLNVTNCILAFIFIPALLGLAFLFWKFQKFFWGEVVEENKINLKLKSFLVCLTLSIILSLALYAVRGLNMPFQAFNLVVQQKVEKELANDDAAHVHLSKSYAKAFNQLIYQVFVTLNYEYLDYVPAKGLKEELKSRFWIYPSFFILGLIALFHKKRQLFWCFIAIFGLPMTASILGLKLGEGRYLYCVFPFFLMTVAAGSVYLFSFLTRWIRAKSLNQALTFTSAFLIFSCFAHPAAVWSDRLQDGMFHMEGVRAVSQYLKKHIESQDVILNVTDSADLVDDQLQFSNFELYFKPFLKDHQMSFLCQRTGSIGIWAILKEPLKLGQGFPFYFPKGYFPQLVKRHTHFAVYYGKIEMSKSEGLRPQVEFSTPFWAFMKARCLQQEKRFQEAEAYYQWMIRQELNEHRSLYNLGLMHSFFNIDLAIVFLKKAIKIIEEPTVVPEDAKEGQVQIIYEITDRKLAATKVSETGIRFFTVEKNGVIHKKWFLEDTIQKYSKYYVEYYLSLGKLFYVKYSRTKDLKWFDEAAFYFSKGLQLHPKHDQKERILGFLESKSLALDPKLLTLRVHHLKGVSDEFPPVFY